MGDNFINEADMISLFSVDRNGVLGINAHVLTYEIIKDFYDDMLTESDRLDDVYKWFKFIEFYVSPYASNIYSEMNQISRLKKLRTDVLGLENLPIESFQVDYDDEGDSNTSQRLSRSELEQAAYWAEIPSDVIEIIEFYENIFVTYSASYRSVVVGRNALSTIQEFLDRVDLNERNNSGSYLMKPKDISSAVLELNKTKTSLDILEKNMYTELKEVKKRNEKIKIGYFER